MLKKREDDNLLYRLGKMTCYGKILKRIEIRKKLCAI